MTVCFEWLVLPGASLLPPALPNTLSESYLRLMVVTVLSSRGVSLVQEGECFLKEAA